MTKSNKNELPIKFRLAAANAASFLPKGYVSGRGHGHAQSFLDAILSYGERAHEASVVLQSCAMANINDKNRQAGPSEVLTHFHLQMEFITGDHKTAASEDNLGVVSFTPKAEVRNDPTARPEVNVVE